MSLSGLISRWRIEQSRLYDGMVADSKCEMRGYALEERSLREVWKSSSKRVYRRETVTDEALEVSAQFPCDRPGKYQIDAKAYAIGQSCAMRQSITTRIRCQADPEPSVLLELRRLSTCDHASGLVRII